MDLALGQREARELQFKLGQRCFMRTHVQYLGRKIECFKIES
jgi:hypothetical protein